MARAAVAPLYLIIPQLNQKRRRLKMFSFGWIEFVRFEAVA